MGSIRAILMQQSVPVTQMLLILSFLLALAVPGKASASECEDPIPQNWLGPGVVSPDIEDRLEITDLLSHYYWFKAQNIRTGVQNLFTNPVSYVLCGDRGEGNHAHIVALTHPDAIKDHINAINDFLDTYGLRSRHFVSNLILSETADPNTVLGKATVLVFLTGLYPKAPVPDYTALLKAEFKRASSNAPFLIHSMTHVGDPAVARSGDIRGR